ncbi:hypothetical protein [Sandaracinobacteroides saxicola]|nr:hypothetical protein [Sandaracinobacteroides saxicola]
MGKEDTARSERLKAALRDNLRKRKAPREISEEPEVKPKDD